MSQTTTDDDLPYAGYPIAYSHPDRLAVLGKLLGIAPADIFHCDVLELGCGDGANLVPMAAELPESRFIGIDSSSQAIDSARAFAAKVGVKNAVFDLQDIRALDQSLGTFDYIICHGVYSWVDAEVRSKILSLSKQLLREQGIAYISYNTLPGWRTRSTLRDLLLYHSRSVTAPAERLQRTRELLDYLARWLREDRTPHGRALFQEIERLRMRNTSYVLHEYLQPINDPIYFHEFVDAATAAGLDYMTDAELRATGGLDVDVDAIVNRLATSAIEWEQYRDFLDNRSFRQTVLCHAGLSGDRTHAVDRLAELYVSSQMRPEPGAELQGTEQAKFSGPIGTLSTAAPQLKTALGLLGERWPRAVPMSQLTEEVAAKVGESASGVEGESVSPEQTARNVRASLLDCHFRKCVEFHSAPPRCAAEVSERPKASAVARAQAEDGQTVTNLAHSVIVLNELQRQLLLLADGTRSEADIVAGLTAMTGRGELTIQSEGNAVVKPEDVGAVLTDATRWNLQQLAAQLLFEA